jgi:hypothetical protein
MKWFVIGNNWRFKGTVPNILDVCHGGWGNGYIVIPKGHFLHGLDYNEINLIEGINAHGGFTLSDSYDKCKKWEQVTEDMKDSWIIGFDTMHYRDNLEKHNKEYVINHTAKLAGALSRLKNKK